jgi:antitoxin FitA
MEGVTAMASIAVRNLPDETHRSLPVRAAMHGRSIKAEIQAILESAGRPEGRVKLGILLAKNGREAGGVDVKIECDKAPSEPMNFE